MRALHSSLFGVAAVLAAAACSSSSTPEDVAGGPSESDDPSSPTSPPRGDLPPGEGTGDGGVGATPDPPPVPYQHFDINHVLSTGQSNSVANGGDPPLTLTQPYANVMFSSGVMTATNCGGDGCTDYEKPTGFAPLVEGDSFFNYPVETMSSSLANAVTKHARESLLASAGSKEADHVVLVSLHGRSGNTYWSLRKGGSNYQQGRGFVLPFEEGMMQVADAAALAKAAGKSYVVRAVTTVHGESDHYGYSGNTPEFPIPGTDGDSTIADYEQGLVEWQRDYETSIQAVTGQTVPVPLLVSQMNDWTDVPTSHIPQMQWLAHVHAPGKVVLVAPTYFLPFASDCIHFTSESERWLGEYFAKAYARIAIEGKPFEPVRPTKITLQGNVIVARFVVPKPPLVLDTTRVTNAGNYGFEYVDETAARPSITKVEVTAADTVAITLSAAPTGAQKRLRYAFTAPVPSCPGPQSGVRGNLRDSDDTASLYGNDLSNWGVSFEAPVE